MLSQIKLQAPLLVVPFRQFLSFGRCFSWKGGRSPSAVRDMPDVRPGVDWLTAGRLVPTRENFQDDRIPNLRPVSNMCMCKHVYVYSMTHGRHPQTPPVSHGISSQHPVNVHHSLRVPPFSPTLSASIASCFAFQHKGRIGVGSKGIVRTIHHAEGVRT